jgi:gamma-glutamyl-gamma-aminobutyrate hydrolase PuuD
MTRRLGITTRIVENASYPEQRDALSREWGKFLSKLFPEGVFIPLVNHIGCVERILRDIDFDGIIISGGNDWGEYHDRDRVERCIVQHCEQHNIPLLGVCRGIQVINVAYGGLIKRNLAEDNEKRHVGVNHSIRIVSSGFEVFGPGPEMVVNSFHNQGITLRGLSPSLCAFAVTDDDIVEGLFHPDFPILGLQWHPERASPSPEYDMGLITNFIESGAFWR